MYQPSSANGALQLLGIAIGYVLIKGILEGMKGFDKEQEACRQ